MVARRHFGSVRKLPSGRFQASYWHEGQRHRAPQTYAAKADALAYLATVETDILRDGWTDPAAGKVMFGEYADEWLVGRHDLAERTAEQYRWLLDRHILPTFGTTALRQIQTADVRAWNGKLVRRVPTTAAKAYRLLSLIMKTAVADGKLVRTPCTIKGASVERAPERPVATVAEVAALEEAMPPHMRIVVVLATWTQLRAAEMLGLRRGNIDLPNKNITINQTRTTRTDGVVVEKGPKTKAGRRTLALPANVVDALRGHLATFTGPGPEALLLLGVKGAPLRYHVLNTTWRRARDAVGRTDDLHLHDLRHTGLTLAAASGATTAELMHRAGHASSEAAMRYQHATVDRDRVLADALTRLANAVGEAPPDETDEPSNH